jgi:hypothetical protein
MKCPHCNTMLITYPKTKRNYKIVKTTPLSTVRIRVALCLTCCSTFLTEEKISIEAPVKYISAEEDDEFYQ